MDPIVRRFPRIDPPPDQADFVLVRVAPDGGRHPLDLKLIGTEGAEVFSVSLTHDRISSLRGKKSKISEDEWETILEWALLGITPDAEHARATAGVEAVAKVEEEEMAITIQKRIEGITQKLGIILIPANEDESVEIYDWCGQTVQAKDSANLEVRRLHALNIKKDEQITKLEKELENFVKLKNDNENQLLEKFSLLLNEKKLKIRDQQRLLANSHVNPTRVEEAMAIRPAPASRSGKRKQDSDSDDVFEKMDIDEEPVVKSEEEEQRQTTPEESTADEDTAEEEPVVPPTKRKAAVRRIKGNEKGEEMGAKSKGSSSKAPPPADSDIEDYTIPPKRELPFSRSTKPTAPAVKPTAPVDDSETDSDDEL